MTEKINDIIKLTKEKIVLYFKSIFNIIKKPEMAVLPGQIAFSMLLSIVPIITLLAFIASLIGINMDTIITGMNSIIPGGIDNLKPIIDGFNVDFGLIILFIWIFYLSSNACNSIILASNTIYGINKSTWIKRRIKALFMTIGIIIIFLFIFIVPVFGNNIVSLFEETSFYSKLAFTFKILKGPISWAIMFIFIRTFYEIAPDRVRNNSHINAGAIFTTICWIILTYIYRGLALNMTNYNLFYGALSNIAFLMMWLYYMSFVFVIGLALNYGVEYEKEIKKKTGAFRIVKER